MGGHGKTIAGVIVDSGKFPWKDNPRFPQFNTSDSSYHGLISTEALCEAAFIGRARVVPLRNTGAPLSPFNAFLVLQGIETLPLRVERHCDNALHVASFLRDHAKVSWVSYGGLVGDRHYDLAQRFMSGKPSSILSFGIQGGRDAGARFIDALQMIKRLVNIGITKHRPVIRQRLFIDS